MHFTLFNVHFSVQLGQFWQGCPMNRRALVLVLAALVVLAAVAVGVSQRDSADIGNGSRDARDELPAFEGQLFSGGTLASSEITGPAVIHVFGSWCPTCQGEAPDFAKLQEQRPDLDYVYIAVEDRERGVDDFFAEYGWKRGPVIDDAGREIEDQLGLTGQPHTIFVARDGSIETHRGPGTFDELDEFAARIS